VIPVKDIIPPRSRPLVTFAILAASAIELIATVAIGVVTARLPIFTAVNMLYLWLFAENVEDRMGHARFAACYLLCGIASAIAQTFLSSHTALPLVLTSGAVAGIIGAYFVLYPRSRILTFFPLPLTLVEVPAVFFLGVFFVLHAPGGAAALAELSVGFVTGAILCTALRRPLVW
jgi:membrane associated rhomboid family serine protease